MNHWWKEYLFHFSPQLLFLLFEFLCNIRHKYKWFRIIYISYIHMKVSSLDFYVLIFSFFLLLMHILEEVHKWNLLICHILRGFTVLILNWDFNFSQNFFIVFSIFPSWKQILNSKLVYISDTIFYRIKQYEKTGHVVKYSQKFLFLLEILKKIIYLI